ncbi:MAG TPA: phosphate ABC transporter ATP-binding protein [Actinomycetota bacterium]|nr:phosphate ABC transporter ATP-binding protein [Actinomycetota bacterium]
MVRTEDRLDAALGDAHAPATLDAEDVHAWFGDHHVLGDITLSMPANSITSLIGPSGCGKSTFLRILNRMHELVPDASLAGSIALNGIDIYGPNVRATDVRRRIGMVFQKPNPFPAMTVAGNVLSGLKLCGMKTDDPDAVVERCLHRAGLWNELKNRLDRPGGALSGGQQQRLCIARSLAVEPQVLLMDEPCSALDPTSTRRIEDTMRELVDTVTIVIVTHNMQQAQRISDRCAFFNVDEGQPGGIVEIDTTERIFTDPSDPRTADYVHGRFG